MGLTGLKQVETVPVKELLQHGFDGDFHLGDLQPSSAVGILADNAC